MIAKHIIFKFKTHDKKKNLKSSWVGVGDGKDMLHTEEQR